MASPPFLGIALSLAVATLVAASTSLSVSSAEAASATTKTVRWSTNTDFAKGTADGLSISNGTIAIDKPASSFPYSDPYGDKKSRTVESSSWISPWVTTGYAAKTIIPSWNVSDAANGTWIRVEVRAKTAKATGSWDTVADWAYGTAGAHRNSGTAQTDDISKVDVDTVVATGTNTFTAWQIRIRLMRPDGATTTPVLSSIGAVAATFSTRSQTVSKTTITKDTELAVPRSSQMIHKGEFNEYGGGGASWCSPTSVAMVLRYFKTGPAPADYSWSTFTDSFVDHAARYTYDYRYDAAGNWPFNTAYAGRYGLDAFVTRLNDLRDAEAFIKTGIPVVAAVKYAKGALTGSAVASSAGHLLVVVGFTKAGKVIVNDPAASSTSTVRRVYDRAQFEKAWLGGSGGVSYVIRPTSTALPTDTARW